MHILFFLIYIYRYLIIPNFFTLEKANELKKKADELLADFSLEGHPLTQFTTGQNGKKHVGDDYFLDSGDKIRFFFEEGAFNDKGELTRPKEKAINKIGHGLHILDPLFASFSVNDQLSTMTRQLGFQDPRVLQSMLIFKVSVNEKTRERKLIKIILAYINKIKKYIT